MDNKEYNINFYKEKYPNDNGFRNDQFMERMKIGENLRTVIDNITPKLNDRKSRQKQIAKALEILSCCNPFWPHNIRRKTGLVVGKVQSGKTTSFTLLNAAAADNGYRLIINLLGTTTSLRDSNLRDVRLNLNLDGNNNWKEASTQTVSGKKVSLNLSSNQIASILKGNPYSRRNNHKKIIYISLLKEVNHINCLIKTLKAAKLSLVPDLKTLIVDDEVDAHSVDISKPKERESSINRHLKELRDVCGSCTYVGYTATSAAIKFSHQNNFLSPDFHTLLEPGNGYVGNEEIFGKPDGWLPESDSLSWTDSHAVKELKIAKKWDYTKTKPRKVDDEKSVLKSMYQPVCDFLVSQEILGKRWEGTENKQVFSMMLVPSLKSTATAPGELNHSQIKAPLEDFLNYQLHSDLQNTSSETYKMLKDIYREKKALCSKKDLRKFPTFKEIIDRLEKIFDPNLKNHGSIYTVETLNQNNKNDIDFDASDLYFIIGGAKLSRGFVVKGLLTTWMPLSPNVHVKDTMQQRGRFFGYKDNYLDLISVYLKRETIEEFRENSGTENQQWRELEQTRLDGVPLPDSDSSYFSAAGHYDLSNRLTSSAKSKRTEFKVFKRGWCSSYYLPFDDINGKPSKNHEFHDHIDAYLGDLNQANKLKIVGPGNRFNATTSVQMFKSCNSTVKDVYKDLILPLLDSKIWKTNHDDKLRDCIKYIKDIHKPQNVRCDIILFDGGLTRTIFTKGFKHNIKAHRHQANYVTGPGASTMSLKGSNYYCGDNRILLHKNINPMAVNLDTAKNNHNLTVQIHKMDGKIDGKKSLVLKDLYAIRILLPRFPL